jgi:hypothetical protein
MSATGEPADWGDIPTAVVAVDAPGELPLPAGYIGESGRFPSLGLGTIGLNGRVLSLCKFRSSSLRRTQARSHRARAIIAIPPMTPNTGPITPGSYLVKTTGPAAAGRGLGEAAPRTATAPINGRVARTTSTETPRSFARASVRASRDARSPLLALLVSAAATLSGVVRLALPRASRLTTKKMYRHASIRRATLVQDTPVTVTSAADMSRAPATAELTANWDSLESVSAAPLSP